MSDEGVRLIARVALVLFLIVAAAVFKALVGPSKKHGQIMLAGTLVGVSSGVILSYPLHWWLNMEVSTIAASFGIVLGWAVAWIWARRIPRTSY